MSGLGCLGGAGGGVVGVELGGWVTLALLFTAFYLNVHMCLCGGHKKTSVFYYAFGMHENRKYCVSFSPCIREKLKNATICVH